MRTQKQIEANYTELIHAGEGIEIEKGKISATGSGGSGGGLTLYGPYFAKNDVSESINSNGQQSFDLNVIVDIDGNAVTYPSTDVRPIIILRDVINETVATFRAVTLPDVDVYTSEWFDGQIGLINATDNSITVSRLSLTASFYSSIEFTALVES